MFRVRERELLALCLAISSGRRKYPKVTMNDQHLAMFIMTNFAHTTIPIPKQTLQMPSLALPLYTAMTIKEIRLEATNPEMMARFVDTATRNSRFF